MSVWPYKPIRAEREEASPIKAADGMKTLILVDVLTPTSISTL